MAVGDYELRSVRWSPARLGVVVLALLSAGIHMALATTTGEREFALLAIGLLAGFVLFFTDLWRPVMYLAAAAYVALMALVWVMVGTPMIVLGVVDSAVQLSLIGLCLYLLVDESARGDVAE